MVVDKHGTIYETGSYIVEEIFCNSELMRRAYFFSKIPNYIKDISSGKRMLESWANIKDIAERKFNNLKTKYCSKPYSDYEVIMFEI